MRAGKLSRLMGDGIGPRTEIYVNMGGLVAMVPCLHQGNVHIKRKLRVWREQKCILLLGVGTPLTCASRQTTLSHVGRERAEIGNLRKFGVHLSPWYHVCTKVMSISKGSYGYGEPKSVFHLSVKKSHLPVKAGKLPRLMGSGIGPRTETCVNLG